MNMYKEKSQIAFDKQAKTYDTSICGEHARALYPMLLEKLDQIFYDSLLDVGCGTAEMLKELHYTDPKKRYAGIDLSTKMIETAREKFKEDVTLLQGDGEYLPFADASFDVIICNDSFHHYPNPIAVLKQMYRVLTPGGCVLIGDCYQNFISRWIMNHFLKFSKEGDVSIYAKKEWETMFAKAGFQGISWEKVSSRSCMIYAMKNV